MLRMLRGQMAWRVLMAGLLNGCSRFSHDPSANVANSHRVVDVVIAANANANPNAAGQAQPVKVCVFETTRSGWIPEGVGDGAPCRDVPLTDGVLSRNQSILQPKETWRYRLNISAGQERWIVIGAEFQQISGVLPLVEQKSSALADSQIRVMVGMTSLSVVANEKMDE